MKSWSRKVELMANVAIILVALAILGVLANRFLKPGKPKPESVTVGSQFVLDQFDWNKSESTFLLALKPGCPYCEQSAPFYRDWSSKLHQSSKTRIVALLPEESADAGDYIKKLGVTFDEVRQIAMLKSKIIATPTLVLVNHSGSVEKVWVGKLTPAEENDVRGAVR